MPMYDHFHPPVEDIAPWTSICSFWVVGVAKYLNSRLPKDRYRALATTHLGSHLEADISEFEFDGGMTFRESNGHGGLATLAAPTALATFEPSMPEEFEVQIQDKRNGMRLVGAIEFISPANKDPESQRTKFISKCLAYLDEGIGLVILDTVTSRSANLHNVLMATMDAPAKALLPNTPTYMAGYRLTREDIRRKLEVWPYSAQVGSPIPSVPLALKDGPVIQLDLEGTYSEACVEHRI